MPEWIGKTISKVRVEKYLARGGMAEVYLGTHLTLERPVAVKVLHSHIEEDPSLQARFHREAKVVAGLRHSNIVQIFDFDAVDGHPFIVMEYLAGPSLAVYLRRLHETGGRLPYAQVNHLLAALASALDYAHRQGVIHRDVKPGNVLLHAKSGEIQLDGELPEDIEPVLTDFGLVRIAHSAVQTTSGAVTGTPAYMSPEQAGGNQVDSRTDVYSLGIVLYEMLAGRVPFEADSTMAVLLMHINQPPPPIAGIHPAIQKVIDHALEKDPVKRYQTCREMQLDFQSAIEISSRAEAETVGAEQKPPQQEQTKRAALSASKGPGRKRVWISLGTVFMLVFCCMVARAANNPAVATETPTEPADLTEPPVIEEPPTELVTSFPPAADGVPVGILHFADEAGTLSRVFLSAVLALPPEGTQYEAWLVGDSGGQTLGVLALNESGGTELVFDEPQAGNLLTLFNRFEITLESNPDDDLANSSGQIIYSSALPPEAFGYMYPLIISSESAPNQVSLMFGLYVQTDLVNQYSAAMLSRYEAGDEAGMRANAEAVINLIVGNQGADYYGDWDGNGESIDPGDGFGLLLNGEQSGYIHGVNMYADYTATATDANAELKVYAESVKTCAQNLNDWAVQLRDLAVTVVQAPYDENLDPTIRAAAGLASQILSGVDADGNQSIDPVLGECGVLTMYSYAYYLPDMYIMPGAGQVPMPGQ